MSKGARRHADWTCTTLALAALLNGTGCLRFGYGEVDRQTGATHDAGMDAGASHNQADASSQTDAQLPAAGGGAGVGGSRGGSAGSGGRNAAAGGKASEPDASSDAAVADAGALLDAGSVDASMPAAGSGGSGGAGGAGGASGSGGALAFANCMQGTGVAFCDGFESAAPWQPPWGYTNFKDGGSAASSTSRKYAGSASGHFLTNDNQRTTAARIAYDRLPKLKSGDIWLRYYYYVPSSVTIDPYFSAGVMSELAYPYQGFSLLIYPTSILIEDGFGGIVSNPLTYTFPRNRWVCVEHHVYVDPSTGYFEVYIDGARKLKTGTGNTVPSNGWESAEVGIHYVGDKQGPVEVYVDNVVVSTAQYGCD